ncbi:MAG: hypothetical protein R2747_17555 [Pyrinomonadaceae bacterium]
MGFSFFPITHHGFKIQISIANPRFRAPGTGDQTGMPAGHPDFVHYTDFLSHNQIFLSLARNRHSKTDKIKVFKENSDPDNKTGKYEARGK